MLKQLHITNFQSHKDSTFDFVDGVNMVVGNSDSGKSAMIRSLRKLWFNRPLGDSMVSSWGGKMQIELLTDDAHLAYSKDKESEYVLGDTHFKAFSTEVPKEITDILNISETNIQNQLDPVFLLSQSPGEIASFFNKIANLQAIDTGTQKVNSAIRELTSDIKYKEAQEEKLNSDLSTYAYIDIFESEVEELEEMEKQAQKLDASFTKLYQWQAEYYSIKDKIEYHQKTLSLEKPLNVVLELIQERAKKDIEAVKLDRLVTQIKDIRTKITEQSRLIPLEKPVSDLLQLMKDRDLVTDRANRLQVLLSRIKGIQDRLENSKPYIASLMAKWDTVEICPLCNQPIKHEIHEINTRISN